MDILAAYEIVEQLNESSMALVYKAIQPTLKRRVIIKKLKEQSDEAITRFKREAYVSAALNHENIVATYDFVYERRNYFLIMEYIDGMDLKTILSICSPLPPVIAAMIIREIARGLEHSHSRNFIHRDIKPANVLISYQGDVKLIDFGVAKECRDSDITQTGIIVGTPIYMSPEQASGDEISNQSDIFSLGVLFYELITGFKPYSASSNNELFSLISQGKYKSPRIFNNTIPFRVVQIIKKSMQKSLQKRYQTASEMIYDINNFLKWDNQVNIKYRLASFMSDVKLLSVQDTRIELDAISEKLPAATSKNYGRMIAVSLLLLFFVVSVYAIYQGYKKRYLGDVKISLNIPDAQIIQDGTKQLQARNSGLLIKKVRAGHHSFRILAGNEYAIHEGRYFVTPNKTKEIAIELRRKNRKAFLSLQSIPTGAKIYVNGEYWGMSPVQRKPVTVGAYKVEIGFSGYQVWQETITVQSNDDLQLFVELVSKQ